MTRFNIAPYGELEPVCARITFGGCLMEFPNTIIGLISKIPDSEKYENMVDLLNEPNMANLDKVDESLSRYSNEE